MRGKNGDHERLRREADINGMCGTGAWFEGGRKTGYLKLGAGVLVIALLMSVAIYANHRRTRRSGPR